MEHNAQFYDGPFLLSKYACNPLYYLLEFGTINKIRFLDLEVPHYLRIFVLVMIMKAFKVIICLLVQFYCTQALVKNLRPNVVAKFAFQRTMKKLIHQFLMA